MSNVDIVLIEETERIPVRIGTAIFYLRRMDQDREREMRLAYRPVKEADERAQAEAVDNFRSAKLDYILAEWKGVKGPGGQIDAPCSPDNKKRLPAAVKMQLLSRADSSLGIKGDAEEEAEKN